MTDRDTIARVEKGFLPKLKKVLRRVPFARSALALFYALKDANVPVAAKIIMAAALAYFISPVDAIPDFLVPLGFVDDAAVIAGAITAVSASLKPSHYGQAEEWLQSYGQESEA
jgi:uncharacterized membrane protein YkvA (DUF1232 family)